MGISRLFRTLLVLAVATMAMMSVTAPAAAQAGLAGQPVALCFARVQAGDTPAKMLVSPARFDCKTRQTKLGSGDFWAWSPRLPSSVRQGEAVALRSGILWQNSVTAYGLYKDGKIVRDSAPDATLANHIQLGGIIEHRMPGRDAILTSLLWRIDGSANLRGILMGARVATPKESLRANMLMAAMYGGFAGMCVALLIYNFAMWVALRHHFQLLYCAMVLTLLVYAFSSSGAILWAWPDLSGATRLRVNYFALGLSAASAVIFARTFFEERVFRGWLNPAVKLVCGLLLLGACTFAALAPWRVDLLNYLFSFSFIAMLALVPFILGRALIERSNYLWVFCLAWAMPVVFAGIRVANNLNYFRWSFWVDNSTILAMMSEALLSSMAIVYRLRLLSAERDDARVKELAARALADIDPLTGLLNRRAFLRQAIGREGEQILLVADIDHFKVVNETIGHDGGDEVLRLVARALRASIPDDALLARIGGEEFAIVAHAGRNVDAESVLARLRTERMPFDLVVTASIGSCSGPLLTENDWKHLYHRADRALYDAKSEGRDRARRGVVVPVSA